MSFAIQKVENVIDAEQVTVTSSAVFLKTLLANYPAQDFQQVLFCNNSTNEIYVNFSVVPPTSVPVGAGAVNVSSTEYIYGLAPGTMMPFWMGRGAFNQCCVVAPSGNSLAMVVIGA